MSNNPGRHDTAPGNLLPFIAAQCKGRTVTIRRNANYAFFSRTGSFLATFILTPVTLCLKNGLFGARSSGVKAAFELLPTSRIIICAKFPGFEGEIQITEDLWAELSPSLALVTIHVCKSKNDAPSGMTIFCMTLKGTLISLKVSPSETIWSVKCKIQGKEGTPACESLLIFGGELLGDDRTLSDYNIKKQSTLHMMPNLRVSKPVIYLFPPVPTPNIRVRVSLNNAWEFSTLYPPAPITIEACQDIDNAQSVTWNVDAKPNGMVLDHRTNREVSYLFWEAETKPVLPVSPACSRPGSPIQDTTGAFNPVRPSVGSADSVLLPFGNVTGYIDDALMSLGLHTEARCSFITYWLPHLQRHKHIALRFLSQTEYEAAAPLSITPTPDVTTRVFMLFRGVDENDLEAWADAVTKAVEDPSVWRDVVGVEIEKAGDTGLFRVLEWGGME
ncbi:hypothetical protein FRC10_003408, partial [Ceratobasidium sp. 414]